MTCTTTNRPRMAAIYAPGTVRARRWHGDGDVRGYRPPSGWTACADLTDIHPITGLALPRAGRWLIETKEKPSSARAPGCSVSGSIKKPGRGSRRAPIQHPTAAATTRKAPRR